MIAVVALSVWMVAVVVVLRCLHVTSVPVQPAEVLPEVPEWASDFWTQARVDAQFRAMTAPLSR